MILVAWMTTHPDADALRLYEIYDAGDKPELVAGEVASPVLSFRCADGLDPDRASDLVLNAITLQSWEVAHALQERRR